MRPCSFSESFSLLRLSSELNSFWHTVGQCTKNVELRQKSIDAVRYSLGSLYKNNNVDTIPGKITKPQVDPIDAHKNKTICIIKKCFVSKTPLENAKIGSARPL